MRCGERRDDIFLLATESLERRPREELEAHLRGGCAVCAGELRRAQEILTDVLLAHDPMEPAPLVKNRLLARVKDDAAGVGDGEIPRPQMPVRSSLWRIALAAGVAALAAAALTATLLTRTSAPLRRENGELQSASARYSAERDELLAAVEELAAERDELQTSLDEQDEELSDLESALSVASVALEMLREPDVDRLELLATDLQPHATASVFWEWGDYTCYLHAENLQRLASDRAYAIWLYEADGTAVLVGTFTPDERGDATFFQKLPHADLWPVRVAVTDEPFEVAESPTGAVHLEAVVPPRKRPRQSG